MARYSIIAKVDQIVTKEIRLEISAKNEKEAEAFARDALQVYPKPVPGNNVERIITNKSTYWIPRSIEFTQIEEEKEVA